MKIVVTGSLGHISKPLTQELVQKGHEVTVISSKPERKHVIEAIGAKAAIGKIEDAGFLTAAFSGNEAVYTMVPPVNYNNPDLDMTAEVRLCVDNYAEAIKTSGLKRVVHLSSIGAHMDKGNGLLRFHHIAESILAELPADVAVTFMRPTGFYYNLYGYINMIKGQGMIAANYGGEDKTVWVSPVDIAEAIADEITSPLHQRKVRYVASDELTANEAASILGSVIGKPDLRWVIISDEQMKHGLISTGMNPGIAAGMVEMYAAGHSGKIYEDYYRSRPGLGKIKLVDFAKEFADVYNKKKLL